MMNDKKREILIKQASASLKKDEWDDVITICTQIIHAKRDDTIAVDAYHYRGIAYGKKGYMMKP